MCGVSDEAIKSSLSEVTSPFISILLRTSESRDIFFRCKSTEKSVCDVRCRCERVIVPAGYVRICHVTAKSVSTWCRQSYSGPGGVLLVWPGSGRSSRSPVLEHP